jgi:TetR/AcrR family transcriptional regulator
MPRPGRVSPDRILAAAAAEFAAYGYAGARVDRIARRARVNKAMLYYHFRSKQGVYRTLLRDAFTRAAARLRAIAAEADAPADQLDRVIEGMAAFIRDHRFFAAVMLRELAEGGAHLDRDTLAAMAAVPAAFAEIVQRGITREAFRPVHPLAAYFTVLPPLLFYVAAEPIRTQLTAKGLFATPPVGHDAFVAHLQETTRRALAAGAHRHARPTV